MLAIEYPVGWEIRTVQTIPAKHYFSPPGFNPPETISNEQITLEVYPRALADRDIANPQSWMPNTGGYEAHWLTPIQIEEADGWLFVWGASAEGRLDIESGLWAYAPTLRAIYYSETHELDVRLSVSFDDESTLLAQEIGLAETVRQRYSVFDHIVKSVRFVEPTPAPTILPTLAVTNTNFVSPLSPSETPTQTTSTWSTYTVTDTLSIEYPVGWEIRTVQTIPAKHYFSPPGFNPPETISNEQITLEVYPRALADRDIANPQSWMPNTGGYEAHWLTPIQIEEADGWLFVWGASAEGRLDIESGLWAYAPTLMAIYYSEAHELDVRLSVSFDDESTLLAQEIGLAETVAQRYPTFEHMMKSVRFVEPTQP